MDDSSPQEDQPFDPTRRRLCPDGACVGVIGDDGRCRECGRTEAQAAAGEEAPSALDIGGGGVGGDGAGGDGASAGGGAGGFDPKRRLCDEGSCVGVVGADGVCPVCGRRSE